MTAGLPFCNNCNGGPHHRRTSESRERYEKAEGLTDQIFEAQTALESVETILNNRLSATCTVFTLICRIIVHICTLLTCGIRPILAGNYGLHIELA